MLLKTSHYYKLRVDTPMTWESRIFNSSLTHHPFTRLYIVYDNPGQAWVPRNVGKGEEPLRRTLRKAEWVLLGTSTCLILFFFSRSIFQHGCRCSAYGLQLAQFCFPSWDSITLGIWFRNLKPCDEKVMDIKARGRNKISGRMCFL